MVEGTDGSLCMMAFAPAYPMGAARTTVDDRRANLLGVVFAVIEIDKVVDGALGTGDRSGIETQIVDATTRGSPQLLSRRPDVEPSRGAALDAEVERQSRAQHKARFNVAGRRWEVTSRASDAYEAEHYGWLPAVAATSILVIALLLAMYLASLGSRTAAIEHLVEQRTAELQQSNESLAAEVTERKRAEDALQGEHARLRQMLDLQEKDRKLVAFEVHDGFVQKAVGAQFLFLAYPDQRAKDAEQGQRTLDSAVALLGQSIAEARRLISGLRPPFLDESGVVTAVEYLIEEASQRGGPAIQFASDVQFQRLAPPLEVAIFRIIQESLNNARRHSGSDHVRVALQQCGSTVRIEIQDWGQGFDPSQVEADHFGLEGIRERAHLFGGQAYVESEPGGGTRILVVLPLVEHNLAQAAVGGGCG